MPTDPCERPDLRSRPFPMIQDTSPSTAQVTTGIRSVLSLASVYRFAQRAIGAEAFRETLASEVLNVCEGDRVLDIGCGTADILAHLPPVDYLGFDSSDRYVEAARERFGDHGHFVTAVPTDVDDAFGDRTLVMAIGVLHHLDDETASEALELAAKALQPGGTFVSVDPTLTDDQHRIARFLIERDRGQFVRTPEQMQRLVSDHFDDVAMEVRHDMLRTPYTHLIVRAGRSAPTD
jgi:SAM-dependent methyltransferase